MVYLLFFMPQKGITFLELNIFVSACQLYFAETDGKERYYMKTRPMHAGAGGGMAHKQMVTRRPTTQAIETRRTITYPSYAVEEIDQEVCASSLPTY